MNLPHIIKNLFHSKSKSDNRINVPDHMFTQCDGCKQMVYQKKITENSGICPECGRHFRITCRQWLDLLCDENSFQPMFMDLQTEDALHFPGYQEKLKKMYQQGQNEAIQTGHCLIDGIAAFIGIMDTDFIMGSMGAVVGERIALLFEQGLERRQPVIIVSRSGGARMHEGVISLMQMAKTAAAIKKFQDGGNLYLSVLSDPTTGGVSASFAMLGNLIIAEPEALIGFAGPRVIQQTIRQNLPEGFQRSEFLLKKGFIDTIIARNRLKTALSQLLRLHGYHPSNI